MGQAIHIIWSEITISYERFKPSPHHKIVDTLNSHYCNQDNVNELLAIDDKIFEDAIVLCKYTNGGRPDKCASVKPHGALAVLQFSDPFDYSHGEETGFPNDAGTEAYRQLYLYLNPFSVG